MSLVFCSKLQQELEALEYPPYPGELGNKIKLQISRQAWQMWLAEQTKIINEQQLSSLDPKSREYLMEQMKLFLFG